MEGTLPFPKMADIDLLNKLKKISSLIPIRGLKIGTILKKNHKEKLEIINSKGLNSLTTYPIEIDLEKNY